MYKSYKIKLDLNNEQRTMCAGHAGTARHAYNFFVDYCRKEYELGNKIPSSIDMHKILCATVKKEFEWYRKYSKWSPQQALRNLETAYKNFHRIQKASGFKLFNYKFINGIKVCTGLKGLHQFKKKGINDSFYLETSGKIDGNKIKLPKFGWIKCFENLPTHGRIKNVTISRTADDWFIAFKLETSFEKTIKKEQVVGVDLGVKTLATLSNGESFKNNKPYNNAKKKLRRQQKELSRRFVKGNKNQSSNYKKSKIKLSKTHQKVANVRKDTLHKITTYLAKNFETVVIEDLKVSNMVKNHNLSSAILDGGFYEFKRQLFYKKSWYGGSVLLVNSFYPSSKLCSICKEKNKELKLRDRLWSCLSCGTKHDRDYNASMNLRSLAVSSTVTAFGDESTTGKPVQLIDELGNKHQMFTFV